MRSRVQAHVDRWEMRTNLLSRTSRFYQLTYAYLDETLPSSISNIDLYSIRTQIKTALTRFVEQAAMALRLDVLQPVSGQLTGTRDEIDRLITQACAPRFRNESERFCLNSESTLQAQIAAVIDFQSRITAEESRFFR